MCSFHLICVRLAAFSLGQRVFSHCNESQDTVCVDCSRDTYQPGWTADTNCIKKKFCDEGQHLQLFTKNKQKKCQDPEESVCVFTNLLTSLICREGIYEEKCS